jgi:MFS family permease
MEKPQEVEDGSPPQSRGEAAYCASEIERLGRERPEVFKSIWVEIGFCFALLGSMFVAEYLISGFNILLPSLIPALNIPKQAETWPASVFSLVTGAFLLPAGRLADMYGGYIVFVTGLVWLLIWTIIAGFSQNYIMLIFCRALQGFGPAAFLPSGIMLLGSIVSAHSSYRNAFRANV